MPWLFALGVHMMRSPHRNRSLGRLTIDILWGKDFPPNRVLLLRCMAQQSYNVFHKVAEAFGFGEKFCSWSQVTELHTPKFIGQEASLIVFADGGQLTQRQAAMYGTHV